MINIYFVEILDLHTNPFLRRILYVSLFIFLQFLFSVYLAPIKFFPIQNSSFIGTEPDGATYIIIGGYVYENFDIRIRRP